MSAKLYVEGGGSANELQKRCREAFAKLLQNCGYKGSTFQVVSCGSRNETFKRFKLTINHNSDDDYVAMWVDSEEPLKSLEEAWHHLANRDAWEKPAGTTDEQVLFMTTSMETLIVADRATLKDHYGSTLQESALPPLTKLEERGKHDVLKKLAHATRNCKNRYEKGKLSFEILAKLNPEILQKYLRSFQRTRRILNKKLT